MHSFVKPGVNSGVCVSVRVRVRVRVRACVYVSWRPTQGIVKPWITHRHGSTVIQSKFQNQNIKFCVCGVSVTVRCLARVLPTSLQGVLVCLILVLLVELPTLLHTQAGTFFPQKWVLVVFGLLWACHKPFLTCARCCRSTRGLLLLCKQTSAGHALPHNQVRVCELMQLESVQDHPWLLGFRVGADRFVKIPA